MNFYYLYVKWNSGWDHPYAMLFVCFANAITVHSSDLVHMEPFSYSLHYSKERTQRIIFLGKAITLYNAVLIMLIHHFILFCYHFGKASCTMVSK
jgi:hypothetical protein